MKKESYVCDVCGKGICVDAEVVCGVTVITQGWNWPSSDTVEQVARGYPEIHYGSTVTHLCPVCWTHAKKAVGVK